MSMVHVNPKTVWDLHGSAAILRVGEWVEVAYAYQPGECSDGGVGCITLVHGDEHEDDEDALMSRTADVRYLLDGRVEKEVVMTRLTIIPMPFNTEGSRTLRTRSKVDETTSASNESETAGAKKTPLEWLKYGLDTRRHEKKGWLKHALIQAGELKEDKRMLWDHVMTAYQCQLACIEGMRAVSGSEFVDPRQHRGQQGHASGGKFVSRKTASQVGIPKNHLTIPYLLHAYEVK